MVELFVGARAPGYEGAREARIVQPALDGCWWLAARSSCNITRKGTLTPLQGRMCAPATVMGNWQKSNSGRPLCHHPCNNMRIPTVKYLSMPHIITTLWTSSTVWIKMQYSKKYKTYRFFSFAQITYKTISTISSSFLSLFRWHYSPMRTFASLTF